MKTLNERLKSVQEYLKSENVYDNIEELICKNIFELSPDFAEDLLASKRVVEMSNLGELNNKLLYKLQTQRIMHKYKLTNEEMFNMLYKHTYLI